MYRDPLRPDAFPGALGLDLGDVAVRHEGDTLQARFTAFGETLPLTPLGGEFLHLEGTPLSVTFALDAGDGEDYLVVRGLGVARRDDASETTRAARTTDRSLHTLSADYPQLTPPPFVPFPTE